MRMIGTEIKKEKELYNNLLKVFNHHFIKKINNINEVAGKVQAHYMRNNILIGDISKKEDFLRLLYITGSERLPKEKQIEVYRKMLEASKKVYENGQGVYEKVIGEIMRNIPPMQPFPASPPILDLWKESNKLPKGSLKNHLRDNLKAILENIKAMNELNKKEWFDALVRVDIENDEELRQAVRNKIKEQYEKMKPAQNMSKKHNEEVLQKNPDLAALLIPPVVPAPALGKLNNIRGLPLPLHVYDIFMKYPDLIDDPEIKDVLDEIKETIKIDPVESAILELLKNKQMEKMFRIVGEELN